MIERSLEEIAKMLGGEISNPKYSKTKIKGISINLLSFITD